MIYVMSDIHGNSRRFNSIMMQINLQPEDTLYILGDVIDRHPDGIKLLRKIMRMKNAKMLIGNHEHMMLAVTVPHYDDSRDSEERRLRIWYNNGGRITHDYLKHIRKSIRTEIFDYLQALPLEYDIELNGKHYKMVHAAPSDQFKAYWRDFGSPLLFTVWKRWYKGEFPATDYTMIFGHTPTEYYQYDNPLRIYYRDNVIGIDCGSGYPDKLNPWSDSKGRLACLRLDDMREFYSEEQYGTCTR